MGELSGVAGDDGLVRFVENLFVGCIDLSDLVEDGDHKNGSFAHTWFGLAKNVVSLEGEGDGFDLYLTGVLESTFSDGSFQLLLEEKLVPAC